MSLHTSFVSKKLCLAALAAALLGLASQAHAGINYDLSATTTPLSNLAAPPASAGNTATLPVTAPAGAVLTFSNFSYSPSSSGGNAAVPASAITVAGLTDVGGQPQDNGIDFTSGNWYITQGSIDSDIMFQVTASSGTLINGIDLHFGPSVTPGSGLVAEVIETVSAIVGGNLTQVASLSVMDDGTNNTPDETVMLPAGYTSLTINKDIQLVSLNNDIQVDSQVAPNSASFTYVTNSFYTEPGTTGSGVPEPASLGLLGVGAIGLMLRRKARA